MAQEYAQIAADEWVSFPGGELEGKRPKALCPACRARLHSAVGRPFHPSTCSACPEPAEGQRRRDSQARTLCFACYRAELDRERALRDAGQLDTASVERFQSQLPFEPLDKPRLEMLKADRASAREAASLGAGRFVDKRRHAQIAARHALQSIAAGLQARQVAAAHRDHAMTMAIHAAELQLPESWLPYVVSR